MATIKQYETVNNELANTNEPVSTTEPVTTTTAPTEKSTYDFQNVNALAENDRVYINIMYLTND